MNCKNCKAQLSKEERYCYNCGQKNSHGRLTTQAFLKESWNEFIRFDKRFFRTLFTLLVPGKLTNEIISGKRARYIKPIRLYIGFSILMIASINIYLENPLDITESTLENVNLNFNEKIKIHSKPIENLIKDDYAKKILNAHNEQLIEYGLIPDDSKSVLSEATASTMERMDLTAVDSLQIIQYDFEKQQMGNQNFALTDIANLSRKDLYKAYQVNYWINKKLLTQNIRFIKQGSNFFIFLMQKVGICILIMIPFLALFLKLVYVRSEFYYSEHLSFSLHTHSFLYLLISLLMGLSLMNQELSKFILRITSIIFPLYLFLALKMVYKQNIFKTALKFIIINWAYLILAGIFIALFAFLSFLLF
jgi:hypothetical protein